MDITEFAFRLLLLFCPGVIAAYVVNALTVHKPKEPFFFTLQAITLGALSYCLSAFVCAWIFPFLNCAYNCCLPIELTFFKALTDTKSPLSLAEIGWNCVSAIFLALGVTACMTYKVLHRVAWFCKLSKKTAELDIWGYTVNSDNLRFATVRDHAKDLVYDGWIEAFSDDGKKAELLLRDVGIYRNSTGDLLYQVGAVYLDLKRGEIALEFRDVPITGEAPAAPANPPNPVAQ